MAVAWLYLDFMKTGIHDNKRSENETAGATSGPLARFARSRFVCVCVRARACVRACVHACVRAWMRACADACVRGRTSGDRAQANSWRHFSYGILIMAY